MTSLNLTSYPTAANGAPSPSASDQLASLSNAMAGSNAPAPPAEPAAGVEPTTASDVFELLDSVCPKDYVEQFQLLRTQLLLFKTRIKEYRDLCTISVMSTLPGEGKSFTAQNLALVLAAAGVTEQSHTETPQSSPKNSKVLLIRSTPTRQDDSGAGALRAPWEDRGIVQALGDATKWPRCIQKVPGVPLYVMPRGATNRQHALSPVNFEKLPVLLDTLREHFEWIVLDGVSYASSPDAAWFSEACDGTLFVVGQNAPGFGGLNDALSQIPPDRMVGLVMNQGITPHKRGFRVRIKLGRRA